MRHGKAGKKFGRTSSHRKAMFRNMVTSLLGHERIITTDVKAKEIGRLAEKMITLGKRGDLHARRQAVAFIHSNEVIKRLFSVYADRYKDRQGGYTRILKLEPRAGDNAPMALVELVDRPVTESKTKDKAKAPAAKSKEKKTAGKEPAKKAKEKKEPKAPGTKSKGKAEKENKAEPEKKKAAPKKKASAKGDEKAVTGKASAARKETPAGEKKD